MPLMRLKNMTVVETDYKPPESEFDVRPLLIGSAVSTITLKNETGSPFDLNAAIERKPTVLVFYRGSW